MLSTLSTRIDSIINLPISKLDQRQSMLVRLLADIVNHETDNGTLTNKDGLEGQSYWNQLRDVTRYAGFLQLGNGHFSIAYRHPLLPGKVLKVGLKKEDSGAAYVAFCRSNAGLEGIPVIHDVQRFEGCYIVVLDELKPIGFDEWCQGMGGTIRVAVEYSEEDFRSYIEGADLSVTERCLLQTCRKIHEFFTGIAEFDMHHGNAMIDPKTGRIVITDPVSFTVDK